MTGHIRNWFCDKFLWKKRAKTFVKGNAEILLTVWHRPWEDDNFSTHTSEMYERGWIPKHYERDC